MTAGSSASRVRVIVLNYNGGDLVVECLRSLEKVDWPRSRLDVLVVDNGSTDGSVRRVAESFPSVRVLQLDRNRGFAGGNNAGLREPGSYDFVALLNNDAFVDENWLAPLVSALERDPLAGAATSKVVFAPSFVELQVSTGAEPTEVEVLALEVDGNDVSRDVRGDDDGVRFVPVQREHPIPAARALVRAEPTAEVAFRSGNAVTRCRVSTDSTWIDIALAGPSFDVINNAGNVLYRDGYGADRGLGERDAGQYERTEDVFAWCGCSVLLSRAYVQDVGLFEENLFVYYEDFDMAWRGRARGWHYVYVPASVVRHVHTATAREGTAFFEHFVERNRLLVTLRNGPSRMVGRAVYGYVRMIVGLVVRDVLSPALRARRPRAGRAGRRLRSFASFLIRAPSAIGDRTKLRARQSVSDAEILRWALPR